MDLVSISVLQDTGDERGASFPLNDEIAGFLGEARGCHCATILPSQIRGNHYHHRQKEILFLAKGTPWILHWDEGEGMVVRHTVFSGADSVVVRIQPGASHAVENCGTVPLFMVGLADQAFDTVQPDVGRRMVSGKPSLA